MAGERLPGEEEFLESSITPGPDPVLRPASPFESASPFEAGDNSEQQSSVSPKRNSARAGIVREIDILTHTPARTPKPPAAVQPSSPSVSSALDRSREIVGAARADADRLVRDAQASIEQERAQARLRGLEEARIEAAKALLDAVALKNRALKESEREIFEIACAVAEEVLGEALKVQRDSIISRIRRALFHALNSRQIVLVLNPTDVEYVRSRLEEIISLRLPQVNIAIKEDLSIPAGNCRLETELSVIESTVSGHLAAIRSHLRTLVEDGAADVLRNDATAPGGTRI